MYLAYLFVLVCIVNASHCYVKIVGVNGTNLLRINEDFTEEQCPENFLIQPHKGNNKYLETNRTKPHRKYENKKGGKFNKGIRRERKTSRLQRAQTLLAERKTSKMQSDQTPVSSSRMLRVQNDRFPPPEKKENPEEKTGTASLTFVFDSTGSMWDDLRQVKIGAAKILETMLERSCKPIYNFVLVPFRDPDVGPITVTQDYRVFQEKLQEIYVHGGGACAENTFKALYEAVNISEPGSFIYVFTDAQSHDYDRYYNDVSTLVQRKQTQVNFVMTDTCPEYHVYHPSGYLVFDKIASLSSGVVYHLNKSDANEVLDFVRVSLCSLKVNLITVDNPNPTTYPENHAIPVDQTLKAFTVSVAGSNPAVNVLSPRGVYSNDVTSLLDLDHIKIVSVKDPEPGLWTVQVSSDSQHSIRCTGISDTNIVYGFAPNATTNIRNTNHRPLKGANNSILVQTTDDEGTTELSSVEITAINGTVFANLPLRPIQNNNRVYAGGPFVPIDEPCYIAIKGIKYDEENRSHPFRRISPTAFSPQLPENPYIEMASSQVEWVGSLAILTCSVKSLVPYTVRWFHDNRPKTVAIPFQQSADAEFRIPNVSLASAGIYICKAENAAGRASKTLRLQVKALPPKVKAGQHKSATSGQSILLSCSVTSSLPYNFTWYNVRSNCPIGFDSKSPRLTMTGKNELLINPVVPVDQGWYLCVANNSEGQSSDKVWLTVHKKPHIKVTPDIRDFQKYDDVVLSCFVLDGIPAPTLTWKKDGRIIQETVQDSYAHNELDVHIIGAESTDAGIYECQASNEIGVSSSFAVLYFVEEPSVYLEEKNVLIQTGEDLSIICHARGIPTPDITWMYANHTPIKFNDLSDKFQVRSIQELLIKRVDIRDEGAYICRGRNKVGLAEANVTLTVGSAPRIQPNMNETQVNIGSNISLCCIASGFPVPVIHWSKLKHRGSLNAENNTLTITDAKLEDGGVYMCHAENRFGSDQVLVDIEIVGLVIPIIKKHYPSSTRRVIAGENVTLSCEIVQGTPVPKITWLKDGRLINVLISGEQLVLDNVNKENIGTYECQATNVAGTDSSTFQIQLMESPTFKEPWTNYREVLEGSSIELPCRAQGDLTLTFSWSVEGKPINDSSKWYVKRNGTLVMNKVAEGDTNVYTCTVSNAVGTTSKAVQLKVLVPPFFKDKQQENVNVIVRHSVTISCSHAGDPTPEFRWYKDDSQLDVLSQYLTLGSNVSDTAVYGCYVKNKAGDINRKINVTVLEPPSIYQDNQEKTIVVQGNSVTLLCNASGRPTPKISWHSNILAFLENSQISFIDNELRIINATSDMSGKITCDAENVVGVDHRSFELEVIVPPKILDNGIPSSFILKEGEDFSLPCIATGKPIPQISWRILSKSETIKQGYHEADMLVLTDNTLVLTGVAATLNNTYSCIATNSAGTDTKLFSISVEENPIYAADPEIQQRNVLETHMAIFECDGTPASWLKDNDTFEFHGAERADEVCCAYDNDQQILKVFQTRPSDSGLYQCLDEKGNVLSTFRLNILTTPQFDEEDFEYDVTVAEGSAVALNCSANGFPTPLVTWRKTNSTEKLPVTEHTVPDIIFEPQHMKYVLHFPNVRLEHSGIYQCTAANKILDDEQPIDREFNLHVLSRE